MENNNNDTPSNGELYRLITAANRTTEETARDIKDYIKSSEMWRESVSEKLSDLDKKVAVANGRTGNHESAIKLLGSSFERVVETISDLKSWKRAVMAVVAVFILFQGGIIYFLKSYIQSSVTDILSTYDITTEK